MRASYGESFVWSLSDLYLAIVIVMIYWWLSARLQYLQCVSNGHTAVLHWGIDMWYCVMKNHYSKELWWYVVSVEELAIYPMTIKVMEKFSIFVINDYCVKFFKWLYKLTAKAPQHLQKFSAALWNDLHAIWYDFSVVFVTSYLSILQCWFDLKWKLNV